jgi:hypothetical protein
LKIYGIGFLNKGQGIIIKMGSKIKTKRSNRKDKIEGYLKCFLEFHMIIGCIL